MGYIKQLYESALSPHAQEVVGFVLLVLSLIGWPLSSLTWARTEPAVHPWFELGSGGTHGVLHLGGRLSGYHAAVPPVASRRARTHADDGPDRRQSWPCS